MMEKQERYFGRTLKEYLRQLPGQMHDDQVFAWQVFPAGRRGFDFTGAELETFVRLSLGVLLDHGAVPFRAEQRPDGKWMFIPVPGLGKTREEVVESIVREWRQQEGEADELGGLAFATQDYIDAENAAG
jgi:hypothetical protein